MNPPSLMDTSKSIQKSIQYRFKECPMKERKAFSRDFKIEAVRLMEEGSKPAAEIARELVEIRG